MEFLKLLEALRTPFWDRVFSLITHLGGETTLIALALIVFWSVGKAQGLYLLTVGCVGTTLNQFLKITFRIPRPWVRDPSFTIVESARADAGGYSFPSGHTQNAFGIFGTISTMVKKRSVRLLLWLLAVLIAFSRMYLGVHTPLDVGVSAVLALILIAAIQPLFRNFDQNPRRGLWVLLALSGLNLLYLLYAAFWHFPADADPELLSHGVENAAKLTGALLGMTAGYWIDLNWVHFSPKASLPGQVLKCLLGIGLILALKEGLKPLLGESLPAGALRYGILTLFASAGWPLTFPLFQKIRKRDDSSC